MWQAVSIEPIKVRGLSIRCLKILEGLEFARVVFMLIFGPEFPVGGFADRKWQAGDLTLYQI